MTHSLVIPVVQRVPSGAMTPLGVPLEPKADIALGTAIIAVLVALYAATLLYAARRHPRTFFWWGFVGGLIGFLGLAILGIWGSARRTEAGFTPAILRNTLVWIGPNAAAGAWFASRSALKQSSRPPTTQLGAWALLRTWTAFWGGLGIVLLFHLAMDLTRLVRG
jgi:hypothetical protein